MSGQLLAITAVTSGLTTVITPSPIVQITGSTGTLLGNITITGGVVTVVQNTTGISLSSSGITITGLPSGTVTTQLLPDTFLPYDTSRSLGGFGIPSGAGGVLAIGGGNIVIDSLLLSQPNIAIQYPAILNNTAPITGNTNPATYITLIYPQVIIPIATNLVVSAGLNQASAVLLDISQAPRKSCGCSEICPPDSTYQIYANLDKLGLANSLASPSLANLFTRLTTCPACPQATAYLAYQCGHKVSLPDPTLVTDIISGAVFIANTKSIAAVVVTQPTLVAANFPGNVLGQWVGDNPVTVNGNSFVIASSAILANSPNPIPTYDGLQVTFSGLANFSGLGSTPTYQIFYAIVTILNQGQALRFSLIKPPANLVSITIDNSTPLQAIYLPQ